jgi:hypothetical protein
LDEDFTFVDAPDEIKSVKFGAASGQDFAEGKLLDIIPAGLKFL